MQLLHAEERGGGWALGAGTRGRVQQVQFQLQRPAPCASGSLRLFVSRRTSCEHDSREPQPSHDTSAWLPGSSTGPGPLGGRRRPPESREQHTRLAQAVLPTVTEDLLRSLHPWVAEAQDSRQKADSIVWVTGNQPQE